MKKEKKRAAEVVLVRAGTQRNEATINQTKYFTLFNQIQSHIHHWSA
jgi:hypothetical protein